MLLVESTLESPAVAQLTPGRLALRRRIEALIGLAAPALDLVLFAGEQVSRVAGRNEIDPEPPRRIGDGARTRPGGAPDGGSRGGAV
jgi:hypothetical protein